VKTFEVCGNKSPVVVMSISQLGENISNRNICHVERRPDPWFLTCARP